MRIGADVPPGALEPLPLALPHPRGRGAVGTGPDGAAVASLGIATLGFAAPAQAATSTIDFETVAPYSDSTPLAIGVATFSGGHVVDSSSSGFGFGNVYRTSSFGCSGCARSTTIDFAVPVSGFSTKVINGAGGLTLTYKVESDTGGTVTKELPALPDPAAAEVFSLPDKGITQVTISQAETSDFWNFHIDDVTFNALPTDKSECNDGGWQAYGVFKSRGDCVTYVTTGGKNQPQG